MEYTCHRKYFPIEIKIRTNKNYGKKYNTPIPCYAVHMDWLIKYQQKVEEVRKRAHDEGTIVGPDDEIIIGENDLPKGETIIDKNMHVYNILISLFY